MKKEHNQVESFEGLYDEESRAELHNISNRKWCFSHVFINASLHFEKGNYSVGISQMHTKEECGHGFGLREWGNGYGGIRFCVKCKLIDCIHRWDYKILYEMPSAPFVSEIKEVGFCGVCCKKISIGGYRSWRTLDEVNELIKVIAPEYGFEYDPSKLSGSWWFLEFPQTASILYQQSTEASEKYIRENFEIRKNGIYPK